MNMTKKYRYRNNNRFKIALLTGSGLLLLFTVTVKTPKMFANEGKKHEVDPTVLFQPPSGEKPPEDTEGGGSRDASNSCDRGIADRRIESAGDRSTLTAIAPVDYDGLTTVSHPTLWVDLPDSAQQAILLIKEGSDSNWHQLPTHSQQSINVEGKTGIVGIKLAQDAPPLKIGKNYQWIVTLVCSDRPNPNDPLVAAGIKRVDAQIKMNVPATLTQLARASLYAEKGIWYDALNILVAEKSSLSDWNNIWVEYLQSGGLTNDIAREPIVEELK